MGFKVIKVEKMHGGKMYYREFTIQGIEAKGSSWKPVSEESDMAQLAEMNEEAQGVWKSETSDPGVWKRTEFSEIFTTY